MLHLYKETFNIDRYIGPDFTGPIYIENLHSEFFHYDIDELNDENISYFYVPGSGYNGLGMFIDDNLYKIFQKLKYDIITYENDLRHIQSIVFLRKDNEQDITDFCRFSFFNNISIRSSQKNMVKNYSLCDSRKIKIAFYSQEDFSKYKMMNP